MSKLIKNTKTFKITSDKISKSKISKEGSYSYVFAIAYDKAGVNVVLTKFLLITTTGFNDSSI